MKRQVSFYITQFPNFAASLDFCCKLTRKVYLKDQAIAILSNDQQLLFDLDQALWDQSPSDFIPHHLENKQLIVANLQQHTPSIILNLKPASPPPPGNWQHLLQVVPNAAPLLEQARQQFRDYQQQHYTLKTHKIG